MSHWSVFRRVTGNILLNSKFYLSEYNFTALVGAQTMGSCRSTADCSASGEIGRMTIEQCCLGTTNGLAFTEVGTVMCTTCIGMFTLLYTRP